MLLAITWQQVRAASICAVFGCALYMALEYWLQTRLQDSYQLAYLLTGRVVIRIIYIKLHQWLTGERGMNPFLNIGMAALGPYVAIFLLKYLTSVPVGDTCGWTRIIDGAASLRPVQMGTSVVASKTVAYPLTLIPKPTLDREL
jgi:ABC-type branched-subunit amino acid transport system permease subunit